MDCTDCRERLRLRVYEGRFVQQCPRCRGMFIEQQALARIASDELEPRADAEHRRAAEIATGRARLDDSSTVLRRRCPACAKLMSRYTYAFSSGITVDGCDEHGIWLDAGELECIEAWAEADRRGMIAAAARSRPSRDRP